MNYPPNQRDWPIGSLVIHDVDAKRRDMLMRVISVEYSKEEGCNIYSTVYNDLTDFDKIGKKYLKKRIYRNRKEYLLNPIDFKIDVPIIAINRFEYKECQ